MNSADLMRLWELVGNREDELGRLTRGLIGEHVTLRARSGDVDEDGEIVDLYERLRRAIGPDRSDDIDPMSQMGLTLNMLLGGATP
jgi:hypothetical protein